MTANVKPEFSSEQINAWRLREQDRLNDGVYTRLPVSWTRAVWFQYGVKDWDAANDKINRYWMSSEADRSPAVIYSAPSLDHFAHVSMADGAMVAFTENDAKGVADRQTRMKPGKYLTKFFSDVLTPQQITDLATAFCAEYAPMVLKFAKTADEIEHVYTHGPSSCMAYPASDYQSSEHPVRAYGNSDLQLAYIGHSDDKLTARALVWPDRKVYGQIYGDEGRIKPLLVAAGYSYGNFVGARIKAIREGDGWLMPYVDHIDSADHDGKWLILGRGSIRTNSTNGLSEDFEHHCDSCSCGLSEDDGYYCDGDGRTLCESCDSNERTTCDRTGERIPNDDAVTMANGDTWSSSAFDRHGFTCAHTDERYPDDEMVEMANGDNWSQDAFDGAGFVCEGNGGNYPKAELVRMADGALWSQEHFDDYGSMVAGNPTRNADAPPDARPYRCDRTLELALDQVTVTPLPVTIAARDRVAVGARVRVTYYVDPFNGVEGTVVRDDSEAQYYEIRPDNCFIQSGRAINSSMYLERSEFTAIEMFETTQEEA